VRSFNKNRTKHDWTNEGSKQREEADLLRKIPASSRKAGKAMASREKSAAGEKFFQPGDHPGTSVQPEGTIPK